MVKLLMWPFVGRRVRGVLADLLLKGDIEASDAGAGRDFSKGTRAAVRGCLGAGFGVDRVSDGEFAYQSELSGAILALAGDPGARVLLAWLEGGAPRGTWRPMPRAGILPATDGGLARVEAGKPLMETNAPSSMQGDSEQGVRNSCWGAGDEAEGGLGRFENEGFLERFSSWAALVAASGAVIVALAHGRCEDPGRPLRQGALRRRRVSDRHQRPDLHARARRASALQ